MGPGLTWISRGAFLSIGRGRWDCGCGMRSEARSSGGNTANAYVAEQLGGSGDRRARLCRELGR